MAKTLLPIKDVAKKLEIPEQYIELVSSYGAKIRLELLNDPAFAKPRGRMILVTATTPTVSGEGKTVTSIGLTQGLAHIGKRAVITSREPSLGPVFGMKVAPQAAAPRKSSRRQRSIFTSTATSTQFRARTIYLPR